jgi:hypothetical protein
VGFLYSHGPLNVANCVGGLRVGVWSGCSLENMRDFGDFFDGYALRNGNFRCFLGF